MGADEPGTWRDEPVRLVPHDPSWAARFAAEAELLRATIGTYVSGGIHHVGSTAVPGLEAKPMPDGPPNDREELLTRWRGWRTSSTGLSTNVDKVATSFLLTWLVSYGWTSHNEVW